MNDDLAVEAITAYLDRGAQVAQEVVEKATAERDYAFETLFEWKASRTLPVEMLGDVDLTAYSVIADADAAHIAAMKAGLDKPCAENLAAADVAEKRAAAVRAWFRARGINWGEDESAVTKKRR